MDPSDYLDLNCFLHLDCNQLAEMASTLGQAKDAENWKQKAGALGQRHQLGRITGHPDYPSHLLAALEWRQHAGRGARRSAVLERFKAVGDLLAIALSRGEQRGLPLGGLLTWRLVDQPECGLQRQGLVNEASALRDRTLELIALTSALYGLYDSKSGAPAGSPPYGWRSALYIDLVMLPKKDVVSN
jgi:hypothetical protein